jgi:DNA repair protein RecO (recombination protein O)
MKLEKDRGIVLKTIKSGETSLLVRIFSRDRGRFSFIAKGARKPGSSFFGLLTPFSVIDFETASGSGRYIPFLRSASRIEYFSGLGSDPEKIVYASMLLEITDKTAQPYEDLEALRLLYISLRAMNIPDLSAEKIHWWFIVHFLMIHGLWPDPEHCAGCHNSLTRACLQSESGALYCPRCAQQNTENRVSLSSDIRKILVHLQKTTPEETTAIQITKKSAVSLSRWLWKLLEIHYESTAHLNTKKVVEVLL